MIPDHLIAKPRPVFLSGESALSHYSNLTAPSIATYAIDNYQFNELKRHRRMIAEKTENSNTVKIEHWKPDPSFLYTGKWIVNPIDLALSLRLERDERIRIALTEVLKKYDLAAEPLWSY